MMAFILFTCVATAPALEFGYIHVMSLLVLWSIRLWGQQQMDVMITTIVHHHPADRSTRSRIGFALPGCH